jgi:predicted O-methyltransferase YrrM
MEHTAERSMLGQWSTHASQLEVGRLSSLVDSKYDRVSETEAKVLRDVEAFGRLHPRMRNVTPEAGSYLRDLVIGTRARNILEIGTSNGYSTLWLGLGARAVGAKVTTIEKFEFKARLAQENLDRLRLLDTVNIVYGDATTLTAHILRPPDLIFLDIWPGDYQACINPLLPRLQPGAVIAADNMISHRDRSGNTYPRGPEGNDYEALVCSYPGLTSHLRSLGSGMLTTYVDEKPNAS